MSITTLVTFIEVFKIDSNNIKSTIHRLQNAKREPSEESNSLKNTINFNGQDFHYLPFVYQGTTINRSGVSDRQQELSPNPFLNDLSKTGTFNSPLIFQFNNFSCINLTE